MRHGLSHAGVGVENDLAGGCVDQSDRQRLDQLATAGLGQDSAAQPALEQVEFGLLSRPRRYADPSGWVVHGGREQPARVGIIYRLSRKVRMASLGWYRPGWACWGVVRASAFSFKARSAWM